MLGSALANATGQHVALRQYTTDVVMAIGGDGDDQAAELLIGLFRFDFACVWQLDRFGCLTLCEMAGGQEKNNQQEDDVDQRRDAEF